MSIVVETYEFPCECCGGGGCVCPPGYPCEGCTDLTVSLDGPACTGFGATLLPTDCECVFSGAGESQVCGETTITITWSFNCDTGELTGVGTDESMNEVCSVSATLDLVTPSPPHWSGTVNFGSCCPECDQDVTVDITGTC